MAKSTYYFEISKTDVVALRNTELMTTIYDNCIMETFFGRLKNEMYYGYEKDYSSFEEFSKAVEEYIDYYNNKRRVCEKKSVNI